MPSSQGNSASKGPIFSITIFIKNKGKNVFQKVFQPFANLTWKKIVIKLSGKYNPIKSLALHLRLALYT